MFSLQWGHLGLTQQISYITYSSVNYINHFYLIIGSSCLMTTFIHLGRLKTGVALAGGWNHLGASWLTWFNLYSNWADRTIPYDIYTCGFICAPHDMRGHIWVSQVVVGRLWELVFWRSVPLLWPRLGSQPASHLLFSVGWDSHKDPANLKRMEHTCIPLPDELNVKVTS